MNNKLSDYPGPKVTRDWPRVSDLPQEDRIPFEKWLTEYHHTRPWIDNLPSEAQDAYFHCDYVMFKRNQGPR